MFSQTIYTLIVLSFELQESSLWFGLCYIVASLSIYDEYSNDVLDMPEGSIFPRFVQHSMLHGLDTDSCTFDTFSYDSY